MNRLLDHAAFAVGLLIIGWTAAGYVPGSPLALLLVLLIGAFYVLGAVELHRFRQATDALDRAVAALDAPPPVLADWLGALPAGLRQAVRLRVEGERVGLPAPAMAPYLAGLLVLLGMLGTFLGMVVTLKGTGLALENATDVDAIRASLAAPVKGLGLAFGTSVAGVAASAMLGLMSALARRARVSAARQLDARIATTLRSHSQAHQREESLGLLRAQADMMPALVTQLQGLVAQMERQGQALHDGLLAGQSQFHGEAQRAYTGLAESVDRSLKATLADSARLAGAAIEPAVHAAMAGLAHEATTLRDALAAASRQQLEGVSAQLDNTTRTLADRWQAALAHQQERNEAVTQRLHAGLEGFAATFEQQAGALVQRVSDRMDRSAAVWTDAWGQSLAEQRTGHDALTQHTRDAATALVAGLEQQAAALLRGVADAHAAAETAAAAREQQRLAAFHDGLSDMTASLHRQAQADAAAVAERQQQICTTLERTAGTMAAQAEAHARGTLGEISRLVDSASEAPRAAAQVIQELRTALSDSLVRDTAALADRQQQICGTLERTAATLAAQAEAQARSTLAEIARLVDAAAEAPRAAAEVIGELRTALSDSLVRDTAALEERNRLMATLGSLLDAVNHASTEQRSSIDALVQAATGLLDRAAAQFADGVAEEARTLQSVTAQVAGGAAEVASLGEGFGVAVQRFSDTSETLGAQLQRIEAALGQTLARSDEQLAYYVAQAREIVDLTLGSQQQIFSDLQRIARSPAEADPA